MAITRFIVRLMRDMLAGILLIVVATLLLSSALSQSWIVSFQVLNMGNMRYGLIDISRNISFITTPIATPNVFMKWSPDLRYVIIYDFSVTEDGTQVANFYTNDAMQRGNPYKLMEKEKTISYSDSLTWSHDASQIAFVLYSNETFSTEIYSIQLEDGTVRQLTDLGVTSLNPRWSADDTQLLFSSEVGETPYLFTMNADGSDIKRLTTMDNPINNFDLSNDGEKIVFIQNRNIFMVTVKDGEMTQLTDDAAIYASPAWLPDDRHIVFSSNRDDAGRWQLYIIDSETKEITRLTHLEGNLLQSSPIN